MPSDHATAAFAIAFAVGVFLHREWGVALAVVAVLIGLSRVWVGVHYPGRHSGRSDDRRAGHTGGHGVLDVDTAGTPAGRWAPGFRCSAAMTDHSKANGAVCRRRPRNRGRWCRRAAAWLADPPSSRRQGRSGALTAAGHGRLSDPRPRSARRTPPDTGRRRPG
jgi:hypothetical protein